MNGPGRSPEPVPEPLPEPLPEPGHEGIFVADVERWQLWGREPALVLALVAGVVQLLIAWGVPLSEGQQSAVNALALAFMGVMVAVQVRGNKLLPAVTGLLAAAGQAALAFGLPLTQDQIASAGALASIIAAGFVWPRVLANASPAEAGSPPRDGS